MADFFDIAYTPTVLGLQDRRGSRGLYGDIEASPLADADAGSLTSHELTADEVELITGRDSLYLATVGENGWPYVQHRGGQPGFVHQLDAHTIGWVERSGNRQYIGTGNIAANGRVAAILVDYPTRRRLKLYGLATHHTDPSPELVERLGGTDVRIDGAITIRVLATNWNCPKFITPRFTEDQITEQVVEPLQAALEQRDARIVDLQDQLAGLEAQLAELRGAS